MNPAHLVLKEMALGLVTAEPGLDTLSAAQILPSWSLAGRIRSEAAFAMLSGTAPVPVSSARHLYVLPPFPRRHDPRGRG
jgi:transposase